MQPHVKHLHVFVRTAVWFVQIANNFGQNHKYSDEQKQKFKKDPKALVAHAKDIEDQVKLTVGNILRGLRSAKIAQNLFRSRMAEFIKDKRLLDGITPKFGIGC